MRIAGLLSLALACTPPASDPQVEGLVDSGSDTADTAEPQDTGDSADTGDTGDSGTPDDTDTGLGGVDPTTCALPALTAHYPDLLPQNPWGTWPAAPACLQARHDVIVILGCPSDSDGSSSTCQEERVNLAVALSDAGYGDTFIPTGAAVANEHVEAEALRDLLLEAGVPDASIFPEPLAEHTDENLYWSTQIMVAQGWQTALVVSDAEHLLYTAVCDANCCVDLGRLATFEWPVPQGTVKAASYALTPPAADVSEAECTHLEFPTRAMCLNLDSRRACADDLQL